MRRIRPASSMSKASHQTSDPTVHPAGELMADYTAGQLHRFDRWLVEAHLEGCSACRRIAARGARVGGEWLMGLGHGPDVPEASAGRPVQGAPPVAPEGVWRKLESALEEELSAEHPWPEMPLPGSVRHEIEYAASTVEWSQVGESTSRVVRVAFDPRDELEFYLVRTPAGDSFPAHCHLGRENLLVLSGSLRDGYGVLRAGDFWHYPSGSSHAPAIGAECECFALSSVQGGLDFRI